MTSQTLAEMLCRADDSMHHHEATDDFPCWHCKQHADAVTAHLAAILADVEMLEAVAEVIHTHMKAVRDRGDYIVGPASDDAARAAIAVIGARLGLA